MLKKIKKVDLFSNPESDNKDFSETKLKNKICSKSILLQFLPIKQSDSQIEALD
jgi:hypothetical protein